ncbi:MAG: hypothetical protein FD131_2173 [Rhodocyclaceae bacterium]|nr:MAG: hypothetical protein FD131_2173 [Rhodocyclaceae bacterium]
MSQSLADLINPDGAPVGLRMWLKSSAYTRRLLLGASGDPWESASQYLSYFSQAQGLLKPDVAVIEVGELFDSWLSRNPEFKPEMVGKRKLSYPLRKLLEQAEPRALLAEVVEAVLAHLRGQKPLVLAMPSPRYWLQHANALAGREAIEVDPDGIEDSAMYIADLARAVSVYDVGGLLFEEAVGDQSSESIDLELYRPIINVAKHYRWPLAVSLGDADLVVNTALSEFEVLISQSGLERNDMAQGVNVSTTLWSNGQLPPLTENQFYFAEVPRDERPEHVLDCLARLRS